MAPKAPQELGRRLARVADRNALEGDRFDTNLHLCVGPDKACRFADLPRFQDQVRALLAPGGQLLAASFDLRVEASPARLAELGAMTKAGRYFGEMDWKGRHGAAFSVLQVDSETLARCAEVAGWRCEVLEAQRGHCLARLDQD